jgi:membrane-bound serine protease (ClpP class)
MVAGLIVCLLGMSAWVAPAAPAATAATSAGHIDVAQVGGLIDPIQIDFLSRAVASADREGAVALVLQLNSGGGVISPSVLHRLTNAITASRVPVAVWVGPNGSRALGAAYAIFEAAPLRGMAPGTGIGQSVNRSLNDTEAAAQGRVVPTLDQATFGDFVVNLDGLSVDGHVLHTAKVVHVDGEPRRQPTVGVRFEKLSLVEQLLHTAASPSVAYLMLLIGLLLIALEFFTIGVGLAAAPWSWAPMGSACCRSGCGRWCSSASPCSGSVSTCRPACPGRGVPSGWCAWWSAPSGCTTAVFTSHRWPTPRGYWGRRCS